MGQTASIAAKASVPQLFVPLGSAIIARIFARKSKGQRIILWTTATMFMLSYFVGLISNAMAQKKKCGKVDNTRIVAPALAPAIMAGFSGIMTYIIIKVVQKQPEVKAGLEAGKTVLGKDIFGNPNIAFASVLPNTLFAYVGGLIGATAAANALC